MRQFLLWTLAIGTFFAVGGSPALADNAPQSSEDHPISAADAAHCTGLFYLALAERSPMSAPADIAKRLQIKPSDAGPDYDISKETFNAYVPPAPDANGKYGLIAALNFADERPGPPTAWIATLDKHHLIWIDANHCGNSRATVPRVGLLLDATFNARKIWPIDPDRVYFSENAGQGLMFGVGFYYSDVFNGMISTLTSFWPTPVRVGNIIWPSEHMAPPTDGQWGHARNGRYFQADIDVNQRGALDKAIAQRLGERLQYEKLLIVPADQLDRYHFWADDAFEQGVEFLDAPLKEIKAREANQLPAGAPATPDEKARKANAALSMAENYISIGEYDRARQHLQNIISIYPGTPAAATAKTDLDSIQGK